MQKVAAYIGELITKKKNPPAGNLNYYRRSDFFEFYEFPNSRRRRFLELAPRSWIPRILVEIWYFNSICSHFPIFPDDAELGIALKMREVFGFFERSDISKPINFSASAPQSWIPRIRRGNCYL